MKKYQVFVSSTFEDLKDERRIIIEAILNSGHIPVGMELFSASNDEQFEYIKKIIDNCDYYVLISAGRYGSINPTTQISYTEQEYEYAIRKEIPTLVFIRRDPFDLPHSKRDDENQDRLKKFRDKISKEKMCKFWDNQTDLAYSVIISLNQLMKDDPMCGWIRATEISELQNEIEHLKTENEMVELKNIKLQSENRNLAMQLLNRNENVLEKLKLCKSRIECKKIKLYFKENLKQSCMYYNVFKIEDIFILMAEYIDNVSEAEFENILFQRLCRTLRVRNENGKFIGISSNSIKELLKILEKEQLVNIKENGQKQCIEIELSDFGITYYYTYSILSPRRYIYI